MKNRIYHLAVNSLKAPGPLDGAGTETGVTATAAGVGAATEAGVWVEGVTASSLDRLDLLICFA
jgi:hypothetical protein